MIYTQSGYIYNILPNALCLQTYKEFLGMSNTTDGLIGSLSQNRLGSSNLYPGYAYDPKQNISQLGYRQIHHALSLQNTTNRA